MGGGGGGGGWMRKNGGGGWMRKNGGVDEKEWIHIKGTDKRGRQQGGRRGSEEKG